MRQKASYGHKDGRSTSPGPDCNKDKGLAAARASGAFPWERHRHVNLDLIVPPPVLSLRTSVWHCLSEQNAHAWHRSLAPDWLGASSRLWSLVD